MKRTVFFDRYRIAKDYDGTPIEVSRIGAAIMYKASDLRSGAPVTLTLLPVESVETGQLAQFEEQARAALLLDHINIARTFEFGCEHNDFTFISESPNGETLAAWVPEHGPLPPDAVLRVALQIVSALSAASFHQVHHHGIEPSNIVIVSGQTAEGGWPAVKLINFPIAGLPRRDEANAAIAGEFASPEQWKDGTVDFRSEIYSLGATLCFLLTGVFYAAEPRSQQTRRFARPLRKLITPMLRQNPEERPQDPMLVAQELRSCLKRVERRQALSRKFGIPFVPVSARPMRKRKLAAPPRSILAAAIERPIPPVDRRETVLRPPGFFVRRAILTAALLLVAATVAALLLPAPVSMILRRNRDAGAIGVPVGVAQTDNDAATQNASAQPATNNSLVVANDSSSTAPSAIPSPTNTVVATSPVPSTSEARVVANSRETKDAPSGKAGPVLVAQEAPPPADPPPAHDSPNDSGTQPPPPTEGPQSVWEQAAGSSARPHITQEKEIESSDPTPADTVPVKRHNESGDQPSSDAPDSAKSHSSRVKASNAENTPTRNRTSASDRRDPRLAQIPSENAPRTRTTVHGSVRARFVGTTPDGGVILRFPNGETAVVPRPPGEYVPRYAPVRRPQRVIIDGQPVYLPPPSVSAFPPDE